MLEVLSVLAAGCADVQVPAATAEAMRYYQSGNILWMVALLWGFIVPFLFLVKGFTGKLESFSKKKGKNWFFTIAVYLVLFAAISQLLNLPLDFYGDYLREHEYGLSTQTLSRWIGNWGIDLFVTMVGLIAFTWIFYLLLKKSPRRWWFYSSLVSIGIMAFLILIQPIWVDPLFNKFGPMQDKKLEKQILELAARAGIEHSRVYEVDKSQDTKTLNAYVTGIGGTSRIVLWDTTIKRMTPDQILFVMGHEMGHYVLNHVVWYLIYFSLLSFVIFYLTYRLATVLLRKYGKRFGIKHLYNISSLPLLLLLVGIFTFVFSPLSNYVSRTMEHQADIFGLEITQDNQAAGESFLVLQQEDLANPWPGPIFNFFRASHPSLGERVDFFNNYCPWKNDEPLRYGKYIHD
ncbi:MAG: M48 family metallopeptidase [Chlamydiota bacterium]